MKIEKINDNQIRCTLTHADLEARKLHLSELAYGTEKAKSLFQDMMQQAAFEFGFETENLPLMIEAIPASPDSIVLIITKVEDPAELDSRFSKIAPLLNPESDADSPGLAEKLMGADSLADLLGGSRKKDTESSSLSPVLSKPEDTRSPLTVKLFSFSSLDNVIAASRVLSGMYSGSNSLYKDSGAGVYILVLSRSDHSENDFSRMCNMLSEYGNIEKTSGATIAFLEEHCTAVVAADAINTLAHI